MSKQENVEEADKVVPSTAWKPGQSGNPNGRPKKGTEKANVKPKVKLRNTLAKLQELEELACEVIKEHLEQKNAKKTDAEKGRLDVAKFVVNKIESLNKACLAEEMAILGIRMKNQEAAETLEEIQEEQPAPKNFSMELAEDVLKH